MPISMTNTAIQPLLSPVTISFDSNGQSTSNYLVNIGSLITQTGTLSAPDGNNDGKISAGEPISHDNPNPIVDLIPDINSQNVTAVGVMSGVVAGVFFEYPVLLVRQGGAQYLVYPEGPPDILTSATGTVDTVLTFYQNASYVPGVGVPCFVAGTWIVTQRGEVKVENLAVGDLIWTVDHGMQPIRWAGKRFMSPRQLETNPGLLPIRIRAGALGDEYPEHDLIVSPQHRVLVRSKIAQRMFGCPELLVAAKQLLEVDGIDIVESPEGLTYYHLLLDRHELIIANGALTETLYTGPQALNGVGVAARHEIYAIFPELRDAAHVTEPARPLITGRRGRQLASRHAKHGQVLFHH